MPDRPGEAGPDVTKGRGTRTSSSETPAAASGPKRPGASAGAGAGTNGSGGPRTRTRTRTGTTKPSGSDSDRGAAPAERVNRQTKGKRRAAPATGAAAPRRASSASSGAAPAAPAADPATDPTTEIASLDASPAVRPAKQRSRRRSKAPRSAEVPPADLVDDDDQVDPPGPKRSRTTPAVRRGRRVRRVIRRIELWSVLKLAIVLYTCMYLAILFTVVVIWGLAYSSGQIENIETFMGEVGLDNYRFYGDRMFKAVAAIGAVAVLAGTVLTVLAAALVNIISEITGGIRVVVIEEEPVLRRR